MPAARATTDVPAFRTSLNSWKNSKMWFNEIVPSPTPIADGSSGQLELAFMEVLPSVIGRCVDFSGTTACDEKYMDMFCEWSGSLDPSIITMTEN